MDPEQQEQYNITSVRQTLKKRWMKRNPPHQSHIYSQGLLLTFGAKMGTRKTIKSRRPCLPGLMNGKRVERRSVSSQQVLAFPKVVMNIGSAKSGICLRNGFDGLAGIVRNNLGKDPVSGNIFIFLNKAGTHFKLLYWDGDGFALFYKRLEKGRYQRCTVLTAHPKR